MPAHKKVSSRQTEILLSHMEANKDFAKGRLTQAGGPLGKQNKNDQWEQLAQRLNCLSNGVTKSGKEWRTYWNNIKYKARAKAAERRKHMGGTGGGPAWDRGNLTEDEWRIMNILGKESIFGEESVQIPFSVEEALTNSARHSPPGLEEALTNSARHSPPGQAYHSPPGQAHHSSSQAYQVNLDQNQEDEDSTASMIMPADTVTPAPQVLNPEVDIPAGSHIPEVTPANAPVSRRTYMRHPRAVPDVPEWARQMEDRNLAAQELSAQALQIISTTSQEILEVQRKILNILNERLPFFNMET